MNYWIIGAVVLFFGYKIYGQNQTLKKMPQIIKEGAVFIDVRSPSEFASAHHEKTINIPLQSIGDRINEIPKDKNVVVFCASGNRSAMAKKLLELKGYKNIYNLGPWTNVKKAFDLTEKK